MKKLVNKKKILNLISLIIISIASISLSMLSLVRSNKAMADGSVFDYTVSTPSYSLTLASAGLSVVDNTITITTNESLIKLSNVNPSEYEGLTIQFTKIDGDVDSTGTYGGLTFQGLGSEANPFYGTIKLTQYGTDDEWILNRAFFRVVRDDATITNDSGSSKSITIFRKESINLPLFADKVAHGSGTSSFEITISPYDDGVEQSRTCGSVIGIMGTDSVLSLTLSLKKITRKAISSNPYQLNFVSEKNAGAFCGVMAESSSLTVSSFTEITEVWGTDGSSESNVSELGVGTFNVDNSNKSSIYYAGALVGAMASGSSFAIGSDFSYTGNVSGSAGAGGIVGYIDTATLNLKGYSINSSIAQSNNTNLSGAGGVAGMAENPVISIEDGKTLTIRGSITSTAAVATSGVGASGIGGVYGKLFVTESTYTVDLSKIDLSNSASTDSQFYTIDPAIDLISSSKTYGTGGAIGTMYNDGGNVSFNFGTNITSNFSSNGTSFGGLIGAYGASSRSHSLNIDGENLCFFGKVNKVNNIISYGGIIGEIQNLNSYSYVNISNVKALLYLKASVTQYGGIVGNAGNGNMIDLGGNITVSDNKAAENVSGIETSANICSGLVGLMNNGVVRIQGITDLTGFVPYVNQNKPNNYTYYGQIVGKNNYGLVYALGDGNGNGWTLKRYGGNKFLNDIGNTGEVVRLSSTMKESTSGFTDNNVLLYFNQTDHIVTFANPGSFYNNVSSKRDLMAIALSFNCNKDASTCLTGYSFGSGSSSSITITADIDMSGTGFTGLGKETGENIFIRGKTGGSIWAFTVNGGNHKITLAIGETYGWAGGVEGSISEGCGQIYTTSTTHHRYIGFINRGANVFFNNVTFDGNIDIKTMHSVYGEVRVGIVGILQNGAYFTNVKSSIDITINKDAPTNSYTGVNSDSTVTVGGFIGYSDGGYTMSFQNCTHDGSIIGKYVKGKHTYGGYIGVVDQAPSDSATGPIISLIDSVVSGDVEMTLKDVNYAILGGFIGNCADPTSSSPDSSLTIRNVLIDGAKISNTATYASGGLLGYYLAFSTVTITGLKVQNSTVSTSGASIGGLCFRGSGYWRIDNNTEASYYTNYGIEFASGATPNTFKIKNVSGNESSSMPCALLVERGGDDWLPGFAMYLTIAQDAYKIQSGSVSLSGSTTHFDEIVGRTINGAKHTGIVNIEVGGKIDRTGVNTYQAQLPTKYTNPYTRYYYNLDSIKNSVGSVEGDVDSGEKMLLWSVMATAAERIKKYFYSNASPTITGTIDLSGLSYYPVNGVVTTINNAVITFDYEQISKTENAGNNIPLEDSNRQHYQMHCGIFGDYVVTSNSTVNISSLTLKGQIGSRSGSSSGALFCGTISGSNSNSTISILTTSISNVTLDGIRVYVPLSYPLVNSGTSDTTDKIATGSVGYAPLLINKVGSYTTLNVNGVTTTSEYNVDSVTRKAASSLIGNVGSDEATVLNVSFGSIALDGRISAGALDSSYHTYRSIFYVSLFIDTFKYNESSSGVYNFSEGETNITYGAELSNKDSGRNPSLQWFYSKSSSYVTYGSYNENGGISFSTAFFRYVKHVEGETATTHELDINQMMADILNGCGAYADPYYVSAEILQSIAAFLDGRVVNGWEIKVNIETLNASGAAGFHVKSASATRDTVIVRKDGKWVRKDDGSTVVLTSDEKMYYYLSNVYYVISSDMTISNFSGLGSVTHPFCGGLIGENTSAGTAPTVTISSSTNEYKQFGGLIRVSLGSVVRNINLVVNDVTIADEYVNQIYAGTQGNNALYFTQDNQKLEYFGGVIGRIIGGDNIIDNVSVSFTGVTIKGTYKELVPAGGYVGMIGGINGEGGGVIFRNINGTAVGYKGLLSVNSESTTTEVTDGNTKYYWNPYVGRILDGFACYDKSHDSLANGGSLNNTDKNYTIPTLTAGDKLSISGNDIQISNAQQLWVLSAIVNSGAGARNAGNYNFFSTNAYKIGRCRRAIFNDVGQITSLSAEQLDDGKCWGVKATAGGDKASYLSYYFTNDSNGFAKVTYGEYRVVLLADCDMSAYGNGFRGIGASYYAFYETGKTWAANLYLNLSSPNSASNDWSVFKGNGHTITLNRKIYEYAYNHTAEIFPTYTAGLFPVLRLVTKSRSDFISLTLSGTISIQYSQAENTGDASIGGFIGYSYYANRGNRNILQDISLSDLTISGAKVSGGIVGLWGKSNWVCYANSRAFYIIQTVGRNTLTTNSELTFMDCSYNNIKISSSYCSGGLVGSTYSGVTRVYSRDRNSLYQNATISITKDILYDLAYNRGLNISVSNDTGSSVSLSNDDFITKSIGGAGGLVGCTNNQIFINNEKPLTLTINNVTINSVPFRFNTNYGLGTIVGSLKSSITIGNGTSTTNISNCKIITNIDGFVGFYENNPDYFLGLHSGFVAGFCSSAIISTNLNITDGTIKNGTRSGGIVGQINNFITLTDVSVSGCTITGSKVRGYRYIATVGGFIGYMNCGNKDATLLRCSLTNNILISDNKAGGIAGLFKSTTSLKMTDALIENNVIATCGADTILAIGTDGNFCVATNNGVRPPSNAEFSRKTTNRYIASASGIICSGGAVDGDGTTTNNSPIYGYNVRMSNNYIGYLLNGENGTSLGSSANYSSVTLENASRWIGLRSATDSYVSYANITDVSSTSYTDGKTGLIVGVAPTADSTNLIQIVGLSVQGSRPNELIGSGLVSSDSYIVYADYTGVATNDVKTESTYVTVNPSLTLTGVNDGSPLTGDGIYIVDSNAVAQKILTDYGNLNTKFNVVYSKITSDIVNTLNGKVTDYSTEEKHLLGGDKNSAILIVDQTNIDKTTNLINSYLSVLTNLDNTSTIYYESATAKTYMWDEGTSTYIENAEPSIVYTSANQFAVSSGMYDNSKNQITVIDIVFTTPVSGRSEEYHVSIIVLVKKVMEYKFYAAFDSGTNYYKDSYSSLSQPNISANDETATALLTYEYIRTVGEWNDYLASGESLLWNFNKIINLEATNIPSDTWFCLVDLNDNCTYHYATATTVVQNSNQLILSSFPNYQSRYLCDLMNLSSSENDSGKFVISSDPLNAALRIGDTYYRLYNDETDSDKTRYEIVFLDALGNALGTEDECVLKEQYFLTIATPSTQNSVVYINMKSNISTTQFATEIVKAGLTTTYALNGKENECYFADLFNQSITITNETPASANMDVSPTPTISADFSTSIEFKNEDAKNYYNIFSTNSDIYQSFAVRLYENVSKADPTSVSIPIGTTVNVTYQIDGNDAGSYSFVTDKTLKYVPVSLSGTSSGLEALKTALSASVGTTTITANVSLDFPNYEIFPTIDSTDGTKGLYLSAVSRISYSETSEFTSSIKTSPVNGVKKFYQLEPTGATLVYTTFKTEINDEEEEVVGGDQTQLGINGNESTSISLINTFGTYTFSQVSSVVNGQTYTARYSLSLSYKNNGTYEAVTELLSTYLSLGPSGKKLVIKVNDTACEWTYDEVSNTINFTSTVTDINLAQYIEIELYVFTDKTAVRYSNYKVELSASLYLDGDLVDKTSATDYIVYTHAKINTAIW